MARLNKSRIGAVLNEAFSARASDSMVSSPHAQHGAAVFVGLEVELTVSEPGRPDVRGSVIAVPPDRIHAVQSRGPTVSFLYDPERSPLTASFTRALGSSTALNDRLGRRLRSAVLSQRAALQDADVLDGLARDFDGWTAGRARPWRPDSRVLEAIFAFDDPSADRVSVVARSGISAAHFQALFVHDIGLPVRTYRLWRRLLCALPLLAQYDATTAAHAAGFADLAHFSRTSRRMLGHTPTALREGI